LSRLFVLKACFDVFDEKTSVLNKAHFKSCIKPKTATVNNVAVLFPKRTIKMKLLTFPVKKLYNLFHPCLRPIDFIGGYFAKRISFLEGGTGRYILFGIK
jgi:hypothetical protein